MKTISIIAAAGILSLPAVMLSVPADAATAHNSSAGAFGASSSAGDTTVSSRHIKHAAKHAAVATDPSDPGADRDKGMYIVKPQREPEYFGHASGADGAMPPE